MDARPPFIAARRSAAGAAEFAALGCFTPRSPNDLVVPARTEARRTSSGELRPTNGLPHSEWDGGGPPAERSRSVAVTRRPGTSAGRALTGIFALLTIVLGAGETRAQVDRPSDERPELPEYEEPERERRPLLRDEVPLPKIPPFEPPELEPGDVLPALPIPSEPDTRALAAGKRVFVREVLVSGNTVLPEDVLAAIAEPYTDRQVSFADIADLADQLTLAYVERGYVTSGATVPEQSLADGVLELAVVEGVLESVQVESDGRFRPSYFESRLGRRRGDPVNVFEIEERLQVLQNDPRIRRIEAQLLPGEHRGESVLRLQVEEEPPLRLSLRSDNYQSPAIGEFRGIADVTNTNITGYGDQARFAFTGGAGILKFEGDYSVPITRWDTTLGLEGNYTWSEVQESDLEDLEIENDYLTVGLRLGQPLYRSLETSIGGFLRAEWRRNESSLQGRGFSFVLGPEDGISKVAVLRFGLDFAHRAPRQVFAARTMLSVGLDILRATHHGDSQIPDGQFVAWLAQLQWARRLPWLDAAVLARFDVQLTDSPLLGIEQFAIGGRYTVRGYAENTLVRDNGLVGSLEISVPVIPRREGRPWLELGPFVDAGYTWNSDRPGVDQIAITTLVGVGVSARSWLTERIRLDVNWGQQLKDIPELGDFNLQREGLYLGLSVELP
jgi:hemolysin activation/secretion protein